MKKIFSKLLVFALVIALSGAVSLFAGCNPSSETVDYEHTIVFYSSQGDNLQTVTKNAIASFEAKYPGWKVVHTKPGGYDDVRNKVTSDLQGGNQPDLAYCYPDHVAMYLKSKKVVDLNKYINSTEKAAWNVTDSEGNVTKKTTEYTVGYTAEELQDFVQTYWHEGYATNFSDYDTWGYQEGSMLTLPFVKSTELMYYNKTALQQAGLSVAATWDELWAQCETLRKRFDKCTPLGVDSGANWFITMCEQNGWGYTSTNDEEHYLFAGKKQAAWLTMIKEYFDKGYFTTQKEYSAYTSGLFVKGMEEGGLVYCIGSSGGASHQNPGTAFEWGIAPIPGSKLADGTVNSSVISQGPSLVMLTGGHQVSNSAEKEMMTFMFIKELLNPTFQAAFAKESGYNSVRLSTSEVEAYKEFVNSGDIIAEAIKTGEKLRDRFYVSPAFIGSSTARDQAESLLYNAMKGSSTPEQALLEAYKNCSGKTKTALDD